MLLQQNNLVYALPPPSWLGSWVRVFVWKEKKRLFFWRIVMLNEVRRGFIVLAEEALEGRGFISRQWIYRTSFWNTFGTLVEISGDWFAFLILDWVSLLYMPYFSSWKVDYGGLYILEDDLGRRLLLASIPVPAYVGYPGRSVRITFGHRLWVLGWRRRIKTWAAWIIMGRQSLAKLTTKFRQVNNKVQNSISFSSEWRSFWLVNVPARVLFSSLVPIW